MSGTDYLLFGATICVAVSFALSSWSHISRRALRHALATHALMNRHVISILAPLVPIIEGALAVVLVAVFLFGASSHPLLLAGSAVSAGVLSLYLAYQVVLLRTRPGVPCGCSGGSDTPVSSWTLVRTAILFGTSIGAVLSPGIADSSASLLVLAFVTGVTLALINWYLPEATSPVGNSRSYNLAERLTSPVWRGSEARRVVMVLLLASLIAGSLVSGAALALAAPFVQQVPAPWWGLWSGALAVGIIMQVARPSFRLPNIRRQIPRLVFDRGAAVSTIIFGFDLGLGWRTKLTTLAPQTIALGLLLLPVGWSTTVVTCVGFAVGRFIHFALRLLSGNGESWDNHLQSGRHLMPAAAIAAMTLSAAASIQ